MTRCPEVVSGVTSSPFHTERGAVMGAALQIEVFNM